MGVLPSRLNYLVRGGFHRCHAALAPSAISGQIRCQSSGRSSRRETAPSVARSIATDRSGEMGANPDAIWDR